MDFEDDGGLSSDSDDDDDDEVYTTPNSTVLSSPPNESEPPSKQPTPLKAVPPALDLTDPATPATLAVSSTTKTPVLVTAGATPVPTTAKSGFIPRMKFTKRLSSHASSSTSSPTVSTRSTPSTSNVSGLSTPVSSIPMDVATKDVAKRKTKTRRFKSGGKSEGAIVWEGLQNPFNPPIRHSRNPVWDEKLLFHGWRYETAFKVQLTTLKWDKLSSNDHIGDAGFNVKELIDEAPQSDPMSGLSDAGDGHSMNRYTLPITTDNDAPWESKHQPVITFKAKY
ncbi:hypothetical protein ONZ45_g8839 [Pleurotus djamor]|nr:hypothetical protein ONZ45_g8839 [Pleurotus djamor]